MKRFARVLIPVAMVATLPGAALDAWAGSQLLTFTYVGFSQANQPSVLGPGAAGVLRIFLVPFEGPGLSTQDGGDFTVTAISNPPGCGAPTLTVDGPEVVCEWESVCWDPWETVTLCVTTDKGPLEVLRSYVAAGIDSIAPTKAEAGPYLPIPGCVAGLDCSGARAETPLLWPPNHRLAPVVITGITGPSGGPVVVTATRVTQDEPLNAPGDGNTCPDAVIEDGVAKVRMERSGRGNGRVYAVHFTATDGAATCEGVVNVCVPHDGSGERVCVDDGQRYVSVEPCLRGSGGASVTTTAAGLAVAPRGVQGGMAAVEYSLPQDGDVLLAVYDVAGRRIATLVHGAQSAGTHEVSWNAGGLKSGLYFYRLRAGSEVVTKALRVVN